MSINDRLRSSRIVKPILFSLVAPFLMMMASPVFAEDDQTKVKVKLKGSGTVISAPQGIECPENCKAKFNEESIVTLTATPSQGETFIGWSGACAGIQESCVLDLDDEDKKVRVNAQFTGMEEPEVAVIEYCPCTDRIGFGGRIRVLGALGQSISLFADRFPQQDLSGIEAALRSQECQALIPTVNSSSCGDAVLQAMNAVKSAKIQEITEQFNELISELAQVLEDLEPGSQEFNEAEAEFEEAIAEKEFMIESAKSLADEGINEIEEALNTATSTNTQAFTDCVASETTAANEWVGTFGSLGSILGDPNFGPIYSPYVSEAAQEVLEDCRAEYQDQLTTVDECVASCLSGGDLSCYNSCVGDLNAIGGTYRQCTSIVTLSCTFPQP